MDILVSSYVILGENIKEYRNTVEVANLSYFFHRSGKVSRKRKFLLVVNPKTNVLRVTNHQFSFQKYSKITSPRYCHDLRSWPVTIMYFAWSLVRVLSLKNASQCIYAKNSWNLSNIVFSIIVHMLYK